MEPFTNYFAGRLLKEFGGGRAGLGTLVTNVDRDLHDASLRDLLPKRATVAGIDGYYFLDSDKEWVINGRMVGSDVRGSAASIERLQLEPQRYFQRTLTPEVSFDPKRTSMRGWNGDINLNRNRNAWNLNAALWAVSPGFESGDLGFHYNGNVWGAHVTTGWGQIQPDGLSRDRYVRLSKFYVWNFDNSRLGDGAMVFSGLTFLNYWNVEGSAGAFRATADDRLTRGGPPAQQPSNHNGYVSVNSDYRRREIGRAHV